MNRIETIVAIILLCIFGQAEIAARTIHSLNGEWTFCTDKKNVGLASYPKGLPAEALSVQVPHTWNVQSGLEDYVGIAWYEKRFTVPQNEKGKDIRIKFHAIYRDAVVYLNGKKIGQHFSSGYNAFYVDVSKDIKFNAENKLVVSVSNSYSKEAIPFDKSFDWANDGGIIRSVELMILERPSIRYAHVKTQNTGDATVDVKLWEPASTPFECVVTVKERGTGKEVASVKQQVNAKQLLFTVPITISQPKLWHFDHPNLYDIQVTNIRNKKEADTFTDHFGFKEVKVEGEKLFLNGEPVRLIGVEWMPGSNPAYGMAESCSFIDKVLSDMKEVNCVVTRFHWQQDEYILDKLDEMGILVQEEVPWWQQPGNLTPETQKIVEQQLQEMVEEHYNHPSIFSWGISNEVSGGNQPQQYIELVAFLQKLDSSRFSQIVANEMPFRKEKDESLMGSIPTWNEYIGTWHGKHRDEVGAYFDIVKKTIGNRPLMITEHGLCEPRFTGGDARRMDEMNFHLREWAKRDWVVVAIYFSLNDYRTHMGEEGSGKLKCRTHGISGMNRERKPSFYQLMEMSSPLEIINIRYSNGVNNVMLRNKNELPSYTVSGYKLKLEGDEFMDLPTLAPGETVEVGIPENKKQFSIERPLGYQVMSHTIW